VPNEAGTMCELPRPSLGCHDIAQRDPGEHAQGDQPGGGHVEILIGVVVVIAAGIGLLCWVNRRNPGTFGSRETHAENQMEERKDWGPR
jgi:hypothetical protein